MLSSPVRVKMVKFLVLSTFVVIGMGVFQYDKIKVFII
jgi:hypothetical protein